MRIRCAPSLLAIGLFVSSPFLPGCGSPSGGGIDSPSLGVDTGGTQDVAEARSKVMAGTIPDPNTITIEGFLSEHDIPLTTPPGAPEIFAATALTWRKPYNEPAAEAEVFVGLGTTIDLANFQRHPQNLAVVIDRSGSMSNPASSADSRSKMDAVKQALHSLVDQLTGDDLLTVVSFNDNAAVDLQATPGDQQSKIMPKIDALTPRGNTDLYKGLKTGFDRLAASAGGERDTRLILFTDAQPTSGKTDPATIVELARQYADQGIGFTLMGVGVDYGTELANDIAQVRGGNAYFLSDSERIAGIFDNDFKFLVSPAGYDLTLQLNVPNGIGIRRIYGVPDYVPGAHSATVHVPTLFFSSRQGGGAIVVRLTFAQAPTFEQTVVLGDASLSYTLPDGTLRSQAGQLTLPAGLAPGGEPAFFSDDAARRAALLLDTALVFQAGVRAAWDNRYADGAKLIQDFLPVFDAASMGLSDRTAPGSRGLSDERALLEHLEGMLTGRYSFYPAYYGYVY